MFLSKSQGSTASVASPCPTPPHWTHSQWPHPVPHRLTGPTVSGLTLSHTASLGPQSVASPCPTSPHWVHSQWPHPVPHRLIGPHSQWPHPVPHRLIGSTVSGLTLSHTASLGPQSVASPCPTLPHWIHSQWPHPVPHRLIGSTVSGLTLSHIASLGPTVSGVTLSHIASLDPQSVASPCPTSPHWVHSQWPHLVPHHLIDQAVFVGWLFNVPATG